MNLRQYSPFFLMLIIATIAFNVIPAMAGTVWELPMFLAAVAIAITGMAALIRLVRTARSDIAAGLRGSKPADSQFTVLQMMVFTMWVAVFFAARRYLSPPRRGDYFIYLIKQFLLFIVIFSAASLPLAWRQYRQQKAAEALRLKTGEPPMQSEAVDGNEIIDDVLSGVDDGPKGSAPMAEDQHHRA